MKKATGARELAETLRNAARRAIRGLEAEGRPLSEIIKDAIKEKPLEAIRALSTLIPKQLEVEHREADPLDELNRDELRALIAEGKRLREAGRISGEGGAEGVAPVSQGEPASVH